MARSSVSLKQEFRWIRVQNFFVYLLKHNGLDYLLDNSILSDKVYKKIIWHAKKF